MAVTNTSRVFGKILFSFFAKPNEFNRQNKRNGHYCFCVLHRIIIKQYHTLFLARYSTEMLTAFLVISAQITLVVFFYGSESLFRQKTTTESSDLKKEKKKQYVGF